MPNLHDQSGQGALKDTIERAAAFLREVGPRDGRRIADYCVALYGRGAIQSAGVVLHACEANHPGGTAPNLRHLFETVVDVHYLLTSESPEEAAARSLAWDVRAWDDVWTQHDDIGSEHPELDTGGVQFESRDEALAKLRDNFVEIGEDPSPLDQAVDALGESTHWHWSGLTLAGRISAIEERSSDAEGGAQLVAMYRSLWKMYSMDSHAAPQWHSTPLAEEDGILVLPAIPSNDPNHEVRASVAAESLLDAYVRLAGIRFRDEEDEEPSR